MSLHSLMFGWEYPPSHSGGLGVACEGLVNGLLTHGTQITLVLPTSTDTRPAGQFSVRGPTTASPVIRYVKSTLRPYEGVEQYATRMHTEAAGDDIRELYGPDLGEAVERFSAMSVTMTWDVEPDVIHCHDWMTYGAGIRAAAHHRVPLVTHIHATELDRTDFHPNVWIADRERQGMLAADRVIAVSKYTKSLLVQHYGIPEAKISIIHNAHDQLTPALASSLTTHKEKVPMVLFLGRLTVQKNPWQFLEVARIVHDLNPKVRFVMAGDGPMLGKLVDHACELGLAECMIFAGKVQREEASALYRQASCFVMPSLSEPFGLVALEAVAHGVPVVLSKQSGAAEVIEHCFTVDFWDTERFADCILTILRDRPLAEQLIAEAPRVLQRLSWKNQASAVMSVYRDLIRS